MRQHVNPLSSFFQKPIELQDFNSLFVNNELPIHLDIGCARGQFLIEMALLNPNWNYVGVEIRSPLILSAQKERDRLKLQNLHFLYCNVNVSLPNWLRKIREGKLKRVSIQFPDPWFKRRHHKRRVLQPSLLLSLAKTLGPGSELFIQSDILSVIQPMINLVEASKCFSNIQSNTSQFLSFNPFAIATEREIYALSKKKTIYRVLYFRNYDHAPHIAVLEKNYNNFQKYTN